MHINITAEMYIKITLEWSIVQLKCVFFMMACKERRVTAAWDFL